MKWMKRGLWIAAWGVWLWLGFGLYRELPRALGPRTCEPFLKFPTYPAGFLAQSNHIAVLQDDASILIYDGETGATVRTISGPIRHDFRWHVLDPRHRNVLFAQRSAPGDQPSLYAVDLSTGGWRRLWERQVQSYSLHRRKPWLVIISETADEKGGVAAAIDYHTGELVGSAASYPSAKFNGAPLWVGDDRFVVRSRGDGTGGIDVWRIGSPPKLVKRIEGVTLDGVCASSPNGRIVCTDGKAVDVFDVDAGRFVFSEPPRENRPPRERNVGAIMPMINEKGTRIFAGKGKLSRLWNVDTGRELWPSGDEGIGFPMDSSSNFRAIETWSRFWYKWLPATSYTTQAVRSMEDGSLLYRIPLDSNSRSNVLTDQGINEQGTLLVRDDGSVYRLPLHVNWPLLTLCQAILALPLVLLWVVLRWRRKRRLRLTSVAE